MQKKFEIETEEDYRDALKRFIQICESQKDEEDLKEMLLIVDLMEKYERANCGKN